MFKNLVDNLHQVVERLRGVVIECLGWKECMERYENENTFAYLDPSYPPETRVDKKVYDFELARNDHIKLRDYIKNWSGKICLQHTFRNIRRISK